jgi:hypothetical protein|tara:strand:- start:2729 stop:3658 length:930 start_codon:yes stop_codon:yes gene_type:complete
MKKNLSKKYDLTQSVTSNYAGEAAAGYISAALLSNKTIANNELTVLNNVEYKANLRKITVAGTAGNLMANATCDFDDSGTVTYAERVLTPKNLDVNTQVCKKEFLSSWEGQNMTAGLNGTLPLEFTDYLIGQTAERVSQEIQQSIWDGNGSNDGQFDGFKLLLAADSDVNDVTGTTLTNSNIDEELIKVIDAIPSAVYGKDDLKIWLPTSAWRLYIQNQAIAGYQNQYHMQADFPLVFNGIKLAEAPGLAADTMVAGRTSNMFFGTDGSSSEVRVLDMAELDGSDNIRMIMRFNAGVNYAFGSDMVLYA